MATRLLDDGTWENVIATSPVHQSQLLATDGDWQAVVADLDGVLFSAVVPSVVALVESGVLV